MKSRAKSRWMCLVRDELEVPGCPGLPADPAESRPASAKTSLWAFWNVLRRIHPPFVLSKHVNQINKDALQFYRLIPFTPSPTFCFLHSISYQVIRRLTFFSPHPTFCQS